MTASAGDPAAEPAAGRSMYQTARRALDNFDAATREGREDDRALYALRMVAMVRAMCEAIEVSGSWGVIVTGQHGRRLLGTFETEADARRWAAERLPAGAEHEVIPVDVRAVQRPIEVSW